MNSVSKSQFTALLMITDLFGLFCCGGMISLMTLYGFLAAAAVQYLFGVVFSVRGGELSKKVKWLYLVYVVFCGGTLFSALWQTSSVIYIPYESSHGIWGRLMTAGLIAAVCLYSSSTGIKTVARAAVIVGALGAACLLIDFASAVFNAEWHNVQLPEKRSFISEFVRGFAYSSGLGSFAVLLGDVRGERIKAVTGYFAVKAAAAVIVLLTVLSVAGGIMPLADFPVITAAQLSQPLDAQRIDSLFLVVFVVFAVFSVSLQVMTGAYIISELFPRFTKWRSTAVIALTVAAAVVMPSQPLVLLRAAAAAAAMAAAPLCAKKTAA
ncbi:MAG: hypothetical protein K6G33_13565 [Ruminococcus sp.]|uniref:hypothetical protein n=1 Tax=Ruminococcus sp. TaxID=41978 RepID=UPI0025D3FD7E|nr:hypothetical protein [Ruminococcus sp.]MCR5601754.1 hypothetical protein [Ruminococcus sp.]